MKKIIIILVILFGSVAYLNLVKETKEIKEQNKCYQILYNEDIIGNGCDKYFENDSWYIEYKEAIKNEEV